MAVSESQRMSTLPDILFFTIITGCIAVALASLAFGVIEHVRAKRN
jgi:hypothetical protein